MDTPTLRVEYRVHWLLISAGGHGVRRDMGSRGGTLDQVRRWASTWVVEGRRAATTYGRRAPVPDRDGWVRAADVTETRVVERVGPEVIDLTGVRPDVVAAITGDPTGPTVAPVAHGADRQLPRPRHADPVVSAHPDQREEP
jgi:hypothetical protein